MQKKMSTQEEQLYKGFFAPMIEDQDISNLSPEEQARRVPLQLNGVVGNGASNELQISPHNVVIAGDIANKISEDVNTIFDLIKGIPNAQMNFESPNKDASKEFSDRNKSMSMDLTSKEAEGFSKKFQDLRFRYNDDINNPSNDGLIIRFQIKNKLEAKSHELANFLDSLNKIPNIRARQEGDKYVVRFSSQKAVDKLIQGLKDPESDSAKALMGNLLKAFIQDDKTKMFFENANAKLIEKNDATKKQMLLDHPEISTNPAKLAEFNKNAEENLSIQKNLVESALFKKALAEGKLDKMLKNAIVGNVAETMFGEFSKVMEVVAEATGVSPQDLNFFIREQFEKYNNSSRDPLVTRASGKINSDDLSLIKTSIAESIDSKITQEEKNLSQNLEAKEILINSLTPKRTIQQTPSRQQGR